jgi:diacylglycerol kinase
MRSGSFKESFLFAWRGILYAFSTQRNMKIHGVAAIATVILGGVLGISRLEWGILVLTIFMVLVAETINTAIEKVVDLCTQEYHLLAMIAKNVAAGAVLLASLGAVIIGIIIFGIRIVNLLG